MSKPRKKYRPRPVLTNPVAYVIEGLSKVNEMKEHALDLRIRHSAAMHAVTHGYAKKADVNVLVGMNNMVESVLEMKHLDLSIAAPGRDAIKALAARAVTHGAYTPTGPEIQALNDLLELHDELMDHITVTELERALERLRHKERTQHVDMLPDAPAHLL